MNRRDFIWTLPGLGASVWLTGCAVDPVTGKKAFVMMGKEEEIAVDRKHSPHQFSEDYGIAQDSALNRYVADVGNRLGKVSHRPDMPYRFHAVNANYVNAYAFPGGSIAATRGILLEMDNEDALAALMGHEVGHVNARHFAERQAKSTLLELAVATASVAAASSKAQYGELAQLVGSLGGGALLAHYSRENEREADALGMEYMSRAGLNPAGMPDLMNMLNSQHKSKPGAMELMFATHPMSSERVANTSRALQTTYAEAGRRPRQRERYMDNTSRLRALKPAINEQQKGEAMLNQKKFDVAETHLRQALTLAPDDYPGLVLMAKTQMAMKRPQEAQPYLAKAKAIYPAEAQASHLTGVAHLQLKQADRALAAFQEYDRLLPGNPNTTFLKGYSLEQMQNKQAAAQEYYNYLQMSKQGNQAQHAMSRLKGWGVIK
jgi:beta-barrel assembly-enhancing protease